MIDDPYTIETMIERIRILERKVDELGARMSSPVRLGPSKEMEKQWHDEQIKAMEKVMSRIETHKLESE
jgi:hypothetical protein